MSNDEILDRIRYSVHLFPNHYYEKPVICMPYELIERLALYMENDGLQPTLLGCHIQIAGNYGLWWVVGYMDSVGNGE